MRNDGRTYFFDGKKSVNIENLPPEAWTIISGGERDDTEINRLRKVVPWLFAGTEERAGAMQNMPFVIKHTDSGEEFDSSTSYQNKLGWWPDPFMDLWLIEACLTLPGRAYFFKKKNAAGRFLGLQYLLPISIKPKIDANLGLTHFERHIGGRTITAKLDEIMYFWGPDETTEIGPPTQSSGTASLAAAGVRWNTDMFAEAFFKRGAIKATIYTTPRNTAPEERSRFKNFIARLTGNKNAFASEVLNADAITATPIGEGIQELANTELTEEKKQEIAAALRVPMSLLFSKSTNFATARQDEKRFARRMEEASKPIAAILNQQLFNELGLTFEFKPAKLEISQEEEVNRSAAQVNLVQAGWPPWLAAEITGYDLPNDMTWEDLQKQMIEFALFRSTLRATSGGDSLGDEPRSPKQTNPDLPGTAKILLEDPAAKVRAAWERHAIKSFTASLPIKGTEGAAPFDHGGLLPALTVAAIASGLGNAKSIAAIKAVFANIDEWREYP